MYLKSIKWLPRILTLKSSKNKFILCKKSYLFSSMFLPKRHQKCLDCLSSHLVQSYVLLETDATIFYKKHIKLRILDLILKLILHTCTDPSKLSNFPFTIFDGRLFQSDTNESTKLFGTIDGSECNFSLWMRISMVSWFCWDDFEDLWQNMK